MPPETAWSSYPNAAYAVLVSIPATLFALWADSFERHVRWMREEDVEFDPDMEVRKLRWMGICGLICQGVVYLLSFTLAGLWRPLPFVFFTLAVLFQHLIQAGIERRLLSVLYPPQDVPAKTQSAESPVDPSTTGFTPGQSGRAIGWSLAAVMLYLTIIQICVATFAVVGGWLKLDQTALALFTLSGVVAGILAGLFVSFALAPFYLRRILPMEALKDENADKLIQACFARAGLKAPSAWLVSTGDGQWHQVFVSGFIGGRGAFSPALFLSKSMLEKFSGEELRAALLKEVSHLALGHLRRRLLAGAGGAVCAVMFSAMILAFSYTYLPEPAIAIARLVAILVPLVLPLALVRRLLLRQEREADLHAVTGLGADSEAMVSLIIKSDLMNGKIDLSGKFPSQSRRTLDRIRAFQEGLRREGARTSAGPERKDRDVA